jgi:hypothetical protein
MLLLLPLRGILTVPFFQNSNISFRNLSPVSWSPFLTVPPGQLQTEQSSEWKAYRPFRAYNYYSSLYIGRCPMLLLLPLRGILIVPFFQNSNISFRNLSPVSWSPFLTVPPGQLQTEQSSEWKA